jgi:uncharacterized spore protein YtfJ
MDVQHLLETIRDTLAVERVFGEPYELDGTTVIPVARIQGGGGGGEGPGTAGGGGNGAGFGLAARPAGVYVLRDGRVRWVPALDVNRIVLGAQVLAIVASLIARSILRSRRSGGGPEGQPSTPHLRRTASRDQPEV